MTAAYLFLSLLAALAFYLATPHQRLWRPAPVPPRTLRGGGAGLALLAAAAAMRALGTWPGVFAALTALMLAAAALPYLDAWRERRRVG